MIEPRPAATVMIARDTGSAIEVFLLRRNSRSAFMPDVFVFPGGAVDASDGSPRALAQLRGARGGVDPAYLTTAARETFEEAGLLFATDTVDPKALASARQELLAQTYSFTQIIDNLGTSIDATALRYFSRWITPPGESRRFDTHFFAARAPAGQTALADACETHDGVWLMPTVALARYAAGNFALIFPTIKHLERLCTFTCVRDLLDYAGRKSIHPVLPDVGDDAPFRVPAQLEGIW